MIRAAKPPTLRDIAEMVGVTPTTVSLALRDNPRISTKMRSTVKQTADELGYRPNAELSRVMMKLKARHHEEMRPTVALVVEGRLGVDFDSPLRDAFQEIAEKAGYAVDVIQMGDPRMSFARLADVLRARGIRGAVLYRIGGVVPVHTEWMEGLAFCCVGTAPEGSKLAACVWAQRRARSQADAPLLQAAMDLLDQQLQHHRLGVPEHGLTVTLS
ncbi:MAG: LacI family DNA-binding transcriptional regulator [Verrucomicrobia bacterium]|nr:LacI family DNA-binding transcriptional regulator [Verrucomicrobiota bacterium]MCH8512793.1 LacI family DNA-binding transcriptional regulator [Kiritimatiellia bacterium]